ncbi:MAG: hypothetical protein LZF64_01640 [Nitrosomonas sp.]|nr:MAG: hypothetical protein LZF64_01640 [Nitrosomonas sp.]
MKQKNAPKGAFFYSAMIDTVLPHQVHWIVPTFPVLRRSGESVEELRCALKRSSSLKHWILTGGDGNARNRSIESGAIVRFPPKSGQISGELRIQPDSGRSPSI